MKIIIIDDELDARKNMRYFIEKYLPYAHVVGEADSVKTGLELLTKTDPDVIFLDIQLGDGTGFELLDKFPEKDFFVIFTTAYDQYAIKAFKYSAVDYLLKPIDIDDFKNTVKKLKQKRKATEFNKMYSLLKQFNEKKVFDKIAIPCKDGTIFLSLEDIICLQASNNNTTIYTVHEEKINACRILKEFVALLPRDDFIRTHQSHVINLQHIRSFYRQDESIIMSNGMEIPVARRRKEALMKILH